MNTVRATAFWTRDRARGGPIANVYRRTAAANRDPEGRVQLSALMKQLEHAKRAIPFYRELGKLDGLDSFPVVNKQTIRDDEEAFRTPDFDIASAHRVYTSGSTGVPFVAYWDRQKRLQSRADALYFAATAGYTLGTHLVDLKAWGEGEIPSAAVRFARNWYAESPLKWTFEDVRRITAHINRVRGPVSILANTSTFDLFVRAMQADKWIRSRKVASIIAQSEGFMEGTSEVLAERYGVSPTCRYGMEEVGMIGQQRRGDCHGAYHPNRASFFIEILSLESDAPMPVGEPGRIVVTELSNRGQPFIRYDTGDRGAFVPPAVAHELPQTLAFVQGRRSDRLYDADDQPLSPLVGYNNFALKYPGVRQYQIVQRGRGNYLLRLNVGEGFASEPQILADLKDDLGATAHIEVQYDQGDYIWKSGKRRAIVSEYQPQERV